MVNEGREPMATLDEVARRFEESARLLLELKGELDKLSSLRIGQERTADSLDKVAAQVAAFMGLAGAGATQLAEAQRQMGVMLRQGARLLDGTEFAELRTEIAALEKRQSGIHASIESKFTALENKIIQLESSLSASVDAQLKTMSSDIRAVHERVNRPLFGRIF